MVVSASASASASGILDLSVLCLLCSYHLLKSHLFVAYAVLCSCFCSCPSFLDHPDHLDLDPGLERALSGALFARRALVCPCDYLYLYRALDHDLEACLFRESCPSRLGRDPAICRANEILIESDGESSGRDRGRAGRLVSFLKGGR